LRRGAGNTPALNYRGRFDGTDVADVVRLASTGLARRSPDCPAGDKGGTPDWQDRTDGKALGLDNGLGSTQGNGRPSF